MTAVADSPSRFAPPARSARLQRLLAWCAGIVLVLGVVTVLAGPARGMREDIGVQRDDVAAQLQVTQRQLETTQAQLRTTEQQLAIAQQQLDLAERQFAEALRTRQLSEEAVAMQRELLDVARATLAEVHAINRKTPDAGAGSSL